MNWRWSSLFLLLAAGASALADPSPPILNSPASNSTNAGPGIFVSYSLPETPASGSVQLAFSNQLQVLTLQLADNTSAVFVVDPHNPSTAPFVVAVNPPSGTLPDGHYDVWLSYQDPATNTPAVAVATNFVLDTVTLTPLLLAPSNNAAVTSNSRLHIGYQLPETPAPGSVQISFQNPGTNVVLFLNNNRTNDFIVDPHFLFGSTAISSATSPALPDGKYMVNLQYQDALNNPPAMAESTNVLTLYSLRLLPTSITYSNGMFQLTFTNNFYDGINITYSVMTSSNLNAPLTNWTDLGPATENPPGHFQFQDTSPNKPSGFYILRAH